MMMELSEEVPDIQATGADNFTEGLLLLDEAVPLLLEDFGIGFNSSGNNLTGGLQQLSSLPVDESDAEFHRIISILHVYVLPIIILIGIVGNTISFLVYVSTPRLYRQSSSLYLAFLAAVDNISLIFIFAVWFGWIGIHIFHKDGWCQTILYCTYVCSFLSAWTVVSFTVERWIVVFHPLKRHQLCTRRRAIIAMVSLTVVSLAFYSFSLFTTSVRYFRGLPVCVTLDKYNAPLQVGAAYHCYHLEAQYTPPTPTRLSCRVQSRRRCVRNSQLVGDNLDDSEQICRQRSRVASCRRCERTRRQS